MKLNSVKMQAYDYHQPIWDVLANNYSLNLRMYISAKLNTEVVNIGYKIKLSVRYPDNFKFPRNTRNLE